MMRVFVKRETDRARDCNTSLLFHVLITPARLAGHQAQARIQRAGEKGKGRGKKKGKQTSSHPCAMDGSQEEEIGG